MQKELNTLEDYLGEKKSYGKPSRKNKEEGMWNEEIRRENDQGFLIWQ